MGSSGTMTGLRLVLDTNVPCFLAARAYCRSRRQKTPVTVAVPAAMLPCR